MIVFTFRQLYDGLKKNPSILDIDANKIRVVVDIKEFFNKETGETKIILYFEDGMEKMYMPNKFMIYQDKNKGV